MSEALDLVARLQKKARAAQVKADMYQTLMLIAIYRANEAGVTVSEITEFFGWPTRYTNRCIRQGANLAESPYWQEKEAKA